MLEWNLGHRWQCVVRWTACTVGNSHSNPFLCRLPSHMVGLDKPCHQWRDSPHLQLPLGLSSDGYMGLLGLDPLIRGLVTSLSTLCVITIVCSYWIQVNWFSIIFSWKLVCFSQISCLQSLLTTVNFPLYFVSLNRHMECYKNVWKRKTLRPLLRSDLVNERGWSHCICQEVYHTTNACPEWCWCLRSRLLFISVWPLLKYPGEISRCIVHVILTDERAVIFFPFWKITIRDWFVSSRPVRIIGWLVRINGCGPMVLYRPISWQFL